MKEEYLAIVEKTLDEVMPGALERPAEHSSSMRYAVSTGGKRIRPLICLASAVAAGGRAEDARYPAAAIELLHNYTLVHDDLPAMDNDTERRGRPSVWAKYGEANAILAGDALQALAFKAAAMASRNVGRIVAELAAAGVGVVQGQVEDIAAGEKDVDFIYRHKTADLFMAAAGMGALAGGGDDLNLGLAFQFEDDLLDGDSLYSREETERRVRDATAAALAALEGLPGDSSPLAALAQSLVGRKK